jgi:CDP-diacylglycerol--glycerol-3-phosphate 3-phosphatidyltransferase
VVLAVLLAVFTEMIGVVAVQIGASRSYRGLLGKSDRAFVFGAVSLLLGAGVRAGRWVSAVLALMVILLLLTIFNRAGGALRELEGSRSGEYG